MRNRLRDKLSAKLSSMFRRKSEKSNNPNANNLSSGNNSQSDTSASTTEEAGEQESKIDAIKKKV